MRIVRLYQRVDRAITYKPADHWIGYIVAISGALMQMMSYGIDNSFSIFSTNMQNDPTLGYPSATQVSYGNSVSLGLSPVFGVFAGYLVDRVPPRVMMFLSTVMLFAGLWLSSSFAKSSAQVTAAYSLLASISSAFMLSPGAAATGSWFRRRVGLGQGINFCGGGVGSAVVPAVLGSLVDVYGWRKTFRLMSAFCSIGLLGTFLSCRRHPIEDDVEMAARGASTNSENEGDDSITDSSGNYEDRLSAGHADANDDREIGDDLMAHSAGVDGQASGLHPPKSAEPIAAASPTTQVIQLIGEGSDKMLAAQAHAVGSPASTEGSDSAARRHSRSGTKSASSTAVAGASAAVPRDTSRCTVAELIQDMHTRQLTWKETFRVFFSVHFLSHFFMFAIYGWAFYGLIYIAAPYVSSMGVAGTVYAHQTPISIAKASTVFTFWGVFQIIGSILIGGLASFTTNAFAYTICAAVGGIATSCLIFCRSYAAFAACWSIVGFCTAGVFAVMPALIARDFHGPNLGFFMGCVFVAGCLGGFSAPPIQAQLQTRYHGNYSYGCVFISCCMTFPGVLCYLLLWPEKQSRVGRLFKHMVGQK